MTKREWTSRHIQRLGAFRLAAGVEGDLLDPRLGLAQYLLAAALERFAALVDRDRLLERHLALLEPLDDRFELLDRFLEGELLDVGVVGVGHAGVPDDCDSGADFHQDATVFARWVRPVIPASASSHGRRPTAKVLRGRSRPRAPRRPGRRNSGRRDP